MANTLILVVIAAGLLHCSMASPQSEDSAATMFEENEDLGPNSFHSFNNNDKDEADKQYNEDYCEDEADMEEYDEDRG